MKRNRLYCDGGEIAYDIEWWKDVAFDNQVTIIIELQRADLHSGDMWCAVESEFVESGCSQGCEAYNPCNGKSGRCRFMKNSLVGTGEKFEVLPDGSVRRLSHKKTAK